MDTVSYRIVFSIVTIPVVLLFLHLCMRYGYNYDVEGDRVRVVLFRFIPVMTIKIANIREIEKRSAAELWKPTPSLKFGNRLWGDTVLIQKKRGFIRSIVITSDNANEFVEHVKEIERKVQQVAGS